MNYRYRVKGKAIKAFILRGMHFRIEKDIDCVITESELTFVKERCKLTEIIDTTQTVANPNSVSVKERITKKVENSQSGVRNEPTSGTNKGKSKATV